MKYRHVQFAQKGGPEVLTLVEGDCPEAQPGQVRVKIEYCGVGFSDVMMRYGVYPNAPPFPFTPGYEIIGWVDQVGAGVTQFAPGERVAALTVTGGYAEFIVLAEQHLVKVPASLDSAEAVSLILNYVTAYQMLHRAAAVQHGEKILIHSAAGGVGTALLQLGRLAGLEMYGTASQAKHTLLQAYGAIPIDYKAEDFVQAIKAKTPAGVDAAFDSIGGSYVRRSYQTLAKGGRLVAYGLSSTVKPGRSKLAIYLRALPGFATLAFCNALPDGKKAVFYGITDLYKVNPQPFRDDLAALFQLLERKAINPIIAQILPLTQAAQAHERLEQAAVSGKILLDCAHLKD